MVNEDSRIPGLLTAAARAADPVVRGVRDAQLVSATPCGAYDVRALLNHLFHVVVGFQSLAAKEAVDFSVTPDYLEGDWRGRFGAETEMLARAWSAPDALEGISGGMGLPQRTVAHMVLGDLTVHAWDLARATGQPFTPDEDAVAEVTPTFAELAPTGRKMGVFGEELPIPADAPTFDRLLGVTGRDPAWHPDHAATG
ncbi:TIGR03086 family metal-binding protein [Streptomyces sp. ODS28]|uniref:TIGR03086 family metal-binding protein n=1 Tax=Streptomyces sp. ODS28 TaxID=3136688 RepID=UPI0031F03CFA